jgi:two-component system, cell cycle sensor histidine kinase and response regulator CckA
MPELACYLLILSYRNYASGNAKWGNVDMNQTQTVQPQSVGSHVRTVFVVEDNDQIREMVCFILESEGLLVVHADCPARALELMERFERPPDLMICDICMPKMSGPELYQLVEQRFPAQPVLFISGYPGEHLERCPEIVTEERLLRKPFRCAELLERVGRLLG